MALELLAIDLGKQSFHLYGVDSDGVILSRKVSRTKLAEAVDGIAPATVAMEACASAHYWARCWVATDRKVRLINPRFVKPFVKGSKNDAVDAEAIFEAAMRPTMRFVPVKSTDQQDLQSLHRPRPADLPTDGADQPYPRLTRRVWHRAATGSVAVCSPGTGRHL
jgi:transposase